MWNSTRSVRTPASERIATIHGLQDFRLPAGLTITEPQLRALRLFGGEPQYNYIASITGERVVAKAWYPTERVVRALVEKRLLSGTCAAPNHRRSGLSSCVHKLTEIGRAIVDGERGYAVRQDVSGNFVAVCPSSAAFQKAKADKLRNPLLRFTSVSWETENGRCIEHVWRQDSAGEFGWTVLK